MQERNDRIFSLMKEKLAMEIAGEIALSSSPGQTIKKWRTLFDLKQREIASKMGVSPSVLSDYEKGKRRSPGTAFIRKFVESLIELDSARGGFYIHKYTRAGEHLHSSLLDLREFRVPVKIGELATRTESEFVVNDHLKNSLAYGYSVIDSLAAIRYMESTNFIYIYGSNSMRVLVFTNVSSGRSPMVAVKVFPLKPSAVMLHGLDSVDSVDWLAKELAISARIPLLLTHLKDVDELINALRGIGT